GHQFVTPVDARAGFGGPRVAPRGCGQGSAAGREHVPAAVAPFLVAAAWRLADRAQLRRGFRRRGCFGRRRGFRRHRRLGEGRRQVEGGQQFLLAVVGRRGGRRRGGRGRRGG